MIVFKDGSIGCTQDPTHNATVGIVSEKKKRLGVFCEVHAQEYIQGMLEFNSQGRTRESFDLVPIKDYVKEEGELEIASEAAHRAYGREKVW